MKTLLLALALLSVTSQTPQRATALPPIPETCFTGGLAIGLQAYTFNRFTAFEAIEKTASAGGKVIEFYPGQRLSPEEPDLKVHHDASERS